ncbi:MAG: TauD/TfdA family dioxygenase [Acidimicrobiales bacterium]
MDALRIERLDGPFGAAVLDVDLREVDEPLAATLRRAWLEHHVLAFPGQHLEPAELVRAAAWFGPIGDDPFLGAMADHAPVVELVREADETTPLFADVWHSDWSFLDPPPAGTMLHGVEIPPVGGDTLFADQHAAYDALPADLKARVDGLVGIHSARRGYARDGLYGDRDEGRTMAILPSDDALATQRHPLVRRHPETGRPALFCTRAYTIGIEGMDDDASLALLVELLAHATAPEHVLRLRWAPGSVVLWDNRSVLHAATGGYAGHRRVLHRLTIAER